MTRTLVRGAMILLAMAIGFGIGARSRSRPTVEHEGAPGPGAGFPGEKAPESRPDAGRERARTAAGAVPGSTAAQAATPGDPAFGSDPIWDDGQAEVALYDAARIVHRESRRYTAVLITVKEDFDASSLVKADPPYEGRSLLPTLKLNIVAGIPTPEYEYRYLTSVFVARENPFQLRKITVGSQEWCGNTFKEIVTSGARAQFRYHSYFDGEGDGATEIELSPGDLAEEQCFVALRSLPFEEGLAFHSRLLAPLTTNRVPVPRARDFEFAVGGPELAEVPAGTYSCWEVVAREVAGNRTLTWRFAEKKPHVLVAFDGGDGHTLALRNTTRRVYW